MFLRERVIWRSRVVVGFICLAIACSRLCNASETSYTLNVQHATSALCVADNLAIVAGDDSVSIVELANARVIATSRIADAKIASISVSGGTLCVAGSAKVEYGHCSSYDFAKLVRTISSPAFDQKNNDNIDRDNTTQLLESCQQFRIDSFDQRLSAVDIAGRDNRQQIVVGDEAGQLYCLDSSGKVLWEASPHAKIVLGLAALSDGTIASGEWTGKITISNLANGEAYENFKQHRGRITDLKALTSRSGPRLYSASTDGTLRLWYPHQARLVRFTRLPESVSGIAATAEDLVTALTNDGRLHFVDMQSTKILRSIDSNLEFPANIAASVAWTVVTDARGSVVVFKNSR